MLQAGALPGALLFRGYTASGKYFGTAFIFDRDCGQIPYQVSGPILDNYERVVLMGRAPRVGANCRIQGYSNGTLEFRLIKAGEPALDRSRTTRSFEGKCRGFPENRQVGILVAPEEEIGKIIEGEGYVACKLIPGSEAEADVLKSCANGSPCEIGGNLRVSNFDVDVIDVQSVKSWEAWKSTCTGKVLSEGDGYYTVGTTEVETSGGIKVITCGFYIETVSKRILAKCPVSSFCEVAARFEKRPEGASVAGEPGDTAAIGYVDHITMKQPPTENSDGNAQPYIEPALHASTSLEVCSAAINDPFRPMIIDNFVFGGRHIAPDWTNAIKNDLVAEYGSFVTVRDDATVERVDAQTGKIACAVNVKVDLQGLAERALEKGAIGKSTTPHSPNSARWQGS